MGATQSDTTARLWMDAAQRRWSLRRAAGESRWRLALHMLRWLQLLLAQTRWLRLLDASPPLCHAALADPRLYERWQRPYICRHFDAAARRRIVAGHYAFVMQQFPARLRERIVLGHSVRVATLPMEDMAPVHVHLRKPSRGDAGELCLLLLTTDREPLASCVLTFNSDIVLVGDIRGTGPHTPVEATLAFIENSHGVHPRDLLVSMVRELAVLHGLAHIRVVTAAARVATVASADVDTSDAFWSDHGALPGNVGCHELPLAHSPVTRGDAGRSPGVMQQRELFRQAACKPFIDAFRVPSWQRSGLAAGAAELDVSSRQWREDAAPAPADRGGLAAAR